MALDPLTALPVLPASISLSDVASAASAAVTAGTGVNVPQAASAAAKTLFGISLSNIVIIVLGLLFIAAGIFSFDKTREVILKAAKTTAEGAVS